MTLPILYSYRRCPYAMRARMALFYAGIQVEIREISLRDKPEHMLSVSPKGTVPVLCLPDGQILEQSIDIMYWALNQLETKVGERNSWLECNLATMQDLIAENDGLFKQALDRYKYPERYPDQTTIFYRQAGEVFLQKLEQRLAHARYLMGNEVSMADIAIFPFVRQFAAVDTNWFATSTYTALNAWLQSWLENDLFLAVMDKHPIYQAREK